MDVLLKFAYYILLILLLPLIVWIVTYIAARAWYVGKYAALQYLKRNNLL